MFYSLKVEHQRLQESLREETCLSRHIVEGITIIQWPLCHLQNKIEEVKVIRKVNKILKFDDFSSIPEYLKFPFRGYIEAKIHFLYG